MKEKIIVLIKEKLIPWLKAYIYNRWLGGKEEKAKAKKKRQEDKVNALQTKQKIATENQIKAQEDLDKTIDEIQSKGDF